MQSKNKGTKILGVNCIKIKSEFIHFGQFHFANSIFHAMFSIQGNSFLAAARLSLNLLILDTLALVTIINSGIILLLTVLFAQQIEQNDENGKEEKNGD